MKTLTMVMVGLALSITGCIFVTQGSRSGAVQATVTTTETYRDSVPVSKVTTVQEERH